MKKFDENCENRGEPKAKPSTKPTFLFAELENTTEVWSEWSDFLHTASNLEKGDLLQ